jgi:glycine/D-amino acid oxidase-like deaminating enzyme
MRIGRLPENDATNGWSRILPQRTPRASLEGDISADWIVVGAGYAGLAAARRLAENRPHESIAVVEAGICGENASGRNSGFAIDLPHTTSSSLDELDGAYSHMRLARGAIEHLKALVERFDIKCDWTRSGKYHAAVTTAGAADMLEPFARELDALGEPYQWIEAGELSDKLGTAHFHRAVYTPGCILMNPAALTRGLADSLPENVVLFENTPVTGVNYANGISIDTPGGSVRAPRMILGVNGFAEQFGFLKGRFVHLALAASLTRQLTGDERRAYGVAAPWGLTPANGFGGITTRYTNDGRILIRQSIDVAMSQRVPAGHQRKMARRHKQLFDKRFPMLANVTVDHSWTGYICMSRNGSPAFGPCASNVWTASCHNGIGVTKGTMSGLLAADMACGLDNPLILDMLSLGAPDRLPPRLLTDIGARAKLQWEVWRNRREA